MKRIRSILGAAALLMAVAGCEAASTLLVTTGHLAGHEETTIGEAFNATFNEPTWRSFETEKGATVVEFTGKTASEFPEFAIPRGGLVRFQFLIKGDKFSISYVEAERAAKRSCESLEHCRERWEGSERVLGQEGKRRELEACFKESEACLKEREEAQRDGRISPDNGDFWWPKPELMQLSQGQVQGILNGRIYGDPVP